MTKINDGNGYYDINDFLNMKNEEILEMNNGKKFDIILSNPPYSGATLHLQFIEKYIKLANKSIVVCPCSWLEDYGVSEGWKKSPKTKYVNTLGKYIENYDYYEAHDFQKIMNIATWCSGIIGVFDENNKNKELYKEIANNRINKYDKEIIEKVAKLIYKNKNKSVLGNYRKHKNEPGYDYFIKLTRVHGHVNCKDAFDNIAPDIKYSLNIPDKEQKEVYFKTKEEAINFFESIKTTFCKYLKKLGCYGAGDFNGGLPFMDDYTKPWTTERFCKYFNISDETKKYIENFFIKYYNKFEK